MAVINLYRTFWLQIMIWYYKLALQQIDPTHEDVPHIVWTLRGLSDQLEELRVTV